ncbi:MAG: hypothetical protein KAJ03_12935, partial [Gammaproteobacteria bacterium]|nr:hypothetical protein [Gammaproteobacteria bacterium]
MDVISSLITGASFAVGSNLNKVYYISIHHKDTDNLSKSVIKNLLNYVRKKGIPLIAHNCSFENEISYLNLGIPLATTYDTRLFSHHLDENTPNGLKALSKRYLEHEQETYKNTLAGRADMSELTGNQVLSYGCDDSLCTAHLAVLFQFMTQCEGSYDFIMQHETPATLPIMDAFLTGVPVDLAKNSELQILDGETVTEKMKVIRQSLAQHVVDQSESAALEVWNHDNNFLTDKLLKQGKTIDEVNEKLSDWKQKLISATKYRELVYVTKQKKLTPGYGLYNKVHKALGGTHKLKDLSSASISAFLVQITEPVSPHLNDFYNCFRGNGPTHVRTKKGANFAALMSLCEAVMSSPGAEDQETMGDELNMNSPNQMLELLYCKLRIPIRVKSKVTRGSQREILGHEGGPGTDEKAMRMAIAEDCPKGDWRREVLEDVL